MVKDHSSESRLAIAETQLQFHKEMNEKVLTKLDRIDKKIEDLTAFKFQLIGISVILPIAISLAATIFQH